MEIFGKINTISLFKNANFNLSYYIYKKYILYIYIYIFFFCEIPCIFINRININE